MLSEIGEILSKNNLTISIAESCTGGAISSRITTISGSSRYFLGSIVSYSNQSKIRDLNVDEESINNFSSVSKEVAIQMTRGVRNRFDSDIALSITGNFGPNDQNKGQVFIAVSNIKSEVVKEFLFSGDRTEICDLSVQESLQMLYSEIKLLISNA